MTIDRLYDAEADTYGRTVQCEDCDSIDDAVEMRRQSDGGWLCPQCEGGYEAEWQDFMTAVRWEG